jgi:hypothetical protein
MGNATNVFTREFAALLPSKEKICIGKENTSFEFSLNIYKQTPTPSESHDADCSSSLSLYC